MPDKEMTDFLVDVRGSVQATSFEKYMLWLENDQLREKSSTWEDNNRGLMEIVGHLADMPVCLSLWTATIDGYKILFYDACSQVVDHRMVDKWLEENLPETARINGRINNTNANNFINVIHAIKYQEKLKSNTSSIQ